MPRTVLNNIVDALLERLGLKFGTFTDTNRYTVLHPMTLEPCTIVVNCEMSSI